MTNAQEVPDLATSNNPALLVSPDELTEFFGEPETEDNQVFVKLLQGANECAAELVASNDITQEVRDLSAFLVSEPWIEIVELGTKDQFESELATAIDPLVQKVLSISGDMFVQSMSYEMAQWIKDTSLLWIKNKGAG
jgi:hypothetical protein